MTVSPDGKYVVLNIWSAETLSWELYRFNADGSNKIKLTELKDGGDLRPQVTADGTIIFERFDDNSNTVAIMKISLEGGKAEKIEGLEPSAGDDRPKISPDGKLLVYTAVVKDKASGKREAYIRVVEYADGKAGRKVLEREGRGVPRFRWTPESDALIYEKDFEQHNLFKLTLADEKETQISSFDLNTDSGNFVLTGDGKRILVFRSSDLDNLVLLKDISED
jgi:Tol biopolymer transport system component